MFLTAIPHHKVVRDNKMLLLVFWSKKKNKNKNKNIKQNKTKPYSTSETGKIPGFEYEACKCILMVQYQDSI